MQYNKILVLSPHTDDAELGCGGTIARMIEDNIEVYVAAFSTAEDSIPNTLPKDTLKNEFNRSMSILGVPSDHLIVYDYKVRRLSYYRQEVLDDLIALRREINPELIFMPSCQDLHQDHQVLHIEGMRAFKNKSVLGYELPWNHITFSAQAFIELRLANIERKWQAMKEYRSQLELERSYFTEDFIKGLAKVRGTQIQTEWAEAFEVQRVRFPLTFND